MIAEWSPGQWALRLVAAVAPVLALLCTGPAGAWPRPWLVVLVLVLSLCYARVPESGVGTGALGAVLVWWGVAFRDGLHAWALPSVALLLAAHVAGLLASYGPDRLGVDPATVRRWVGRGAGAWLVAPAVFGAALVVRARSDLPGVWVAGLSVALVAMVVASLALARED
ncbi:hypothetical protein [Nocardioides panaciterrulae]|uniref:Uncharacterized protein n=1 Tax=Nocardioides panaciterrulae TaxID=661492 RepID=A0A7Y9E4C2_9ACTN|nr:hypothetical protein [Nocardioides panaciterrulae]NYD41006.1 hypothetical protein [Nocardioides panaciterrulae]